MFGHEPGRGKLLLGVVLIVLIAALFILLRPH